MHHGAVELCNFLSNTSFTSRSVYAGDAREICSSANIVGLRTGGSFLIALLLVFLMHFSSSSSLSSTIFTEGGAGHFYASALSESSTHIFGESDKNALTQAEFFWSQARKNDFLAYSYEVTTNHNDSEHGLYLKVDEYIGENRIPSGGGTSFHAVWSVTCPQTRRPLSVASCAIQDTLSGTYMVHCRPPMYHAVGRSQFIIEVEFINFEVFAKSPVHPPGKARQAIVYNSHWMGEDTVAGTGGRELLHIARALHAENSTAQAVFPAVTTQDWPECNTTASLSSRGEWVADAQGTLRWVRATECCTTPILSDNQVAECLERVGPIAIVGDSHLRRMSKWLLSYFGFTPEQLTYIKTDASLVPSIKFFFSTTGSNLYKRVVDEDILEMGETAQAIDGSTQTSFGTRKVVVMNSCHWDLSQDLGRYVDTASPAIVDVVRRIR